ncbi:hypothetical protein EUX98_g4275 [Antrodiella citrinella]|uniref:Uncharacterized protein n=1 Tax=Antrodiella citrinella TaxID=2447956 RepID=A0A4S4MVG7_9APHY|nr:hypothetical protein EUX98_g4275 [Antrodiella citrinella]
MLFLLSRDTTGSVTCLIGLALGVVPNIPTSFSVTSSAVPYSLTLPSGPSTITSATGFCASPRTLWPFGPTSPNPNPLAKLIVPVPVGVGGTSDAVILDAVVRVGESAGTRLLPPLLVLALGAKEIAPRVDGPVMLRPRDA